jgi:hypothetical protein
MPNRLICYESGNGIFRTWEKVAVFSYRKEIIRYYLGPAGTTIYRSNGDLVKHVAMVCALLNQADPDLRRSI